VVATPPAQERLLSGNLAGDADDPQVAGCGCTRTSAVRQATATPKRSPVLLLVGSFHETGPCSVAYRWRCIEIARAVQELDELAELDQVGDFHLLHDLLAMRLDRPLGPAEAVGDLLG
jgi:hypothetical protein